jgi:flagellar assembly protein FliH
MAHLFKARNVDDDAFPMPRQPGAPDPAMAEAAQIDPAQVSAVAADMDRIAAIVSGLRPQVEMVSDALRASGTQQGYADGIARAQAEVQAHVVEAMTALTDAQRQRHEIAQANEGALADLALKIARKVIGAHLDADPGIVARIVAHAISELEPTTALSAHVNPADVPLVENSRAELERLVAGPGKVEIVADDGVMRGGVVLVSPVGEVDARIETKLAVLEQAFASQRRQLIEGV